MAPHIFLFLFYPIYLPAGISMVAVNGDLQAQVHNVNFSSGQMLQRQITHPLEELAVGMAIMAQHLLHKTRIAAHPQQQTDPAQLLNKPFTDLLKPLMHASSVQTVLCTLP
jgi:hypothetical protein